jgi:hypothetical protein
MVNLSARRSRLLAPEAALCAAHGAQSVERGRGKQEARHVKIEEHKRRRLKRIVFGLRR